MVRRTSVVCVVAVLVMASMASGATVWNPAANEIVPPATGNWNDAANWTNDVPGVADPKAVFNVPDAAECVVTDAQSFNQFVQGDNNVGGVIRVQDGGSLTTGDNWSGVGYNSTAHMIVETGGSVDFGQDARVGMLDGADGTLEINGGTVNVVRRIRVGQDSGSTGLVRVQDGGRLTTSNTWSAVGDDGTGNMIVETGGVVDFVGHLWVGKDPGSVGTLDINGGTVNVGEMIGLGWSGGTGYVNVNDGLLNLSNIHGDGDSVKGISKIDIELGAVTLPGDFTAVIEAYVAAGKITGYGIEGNVQAVFADDVTTVTAIPEPGTMVLLGVGAMGLGAVGLLRRRRRAVA